VSRILFVSTDANLRAAASRVLTSAGFVVSAVAHTGHASLACLEGTPFDVLIVEQQLLDSGATTLAWLRRYCPDLQVVRVCDREAVAGEGIAVVRPMTADDLLDAVLRAASTIPVA